MASANPKPCCVFSPEDLEALSIPIPSSENDSKLCKNLEVEFSNQIQDNKMEVFLRIRPFTSNEVNDECIEIKSATEVVLKAPVSSAAFKNSSQDSNNVNTKFIFSEVFEPRCGQKQFYIKAIDKTIKEFLSGQNCLVFAYGATNSGKTYTVQGNTDNPGVIPSSLEVIFNTLQYNLMNNPKYRPVSSNVIEQLSTLDQDLTRESKKELLRGIKDVKFFNSKENLTTSQESMDIFETTNLTNLTKVHINTDVLSNSSFLIYVSFAEIYNEQLFDLLTTCTNMKKRPKLHLVQDTANNPFIKGLTKIWVTSFEEAQMVFYLGRKNLHMAATKSNHQSSRSHCIFSVYVIKVTDSEANIAYVNNLSFCDLAGSERVVKTKNTGERLKEAGNINTSLMVLGRCIDALRINQSSKAISIVPFRDSKLTRLFQSFFIGQGRASMIVNIAPSSDMFDDTLNVLKFSALAKEVITKDKNDKSIMNMTASISERLTNFWVKSNRRWSSLAAQHPNLKQSIMTIPEIGSDNDLATLDEDDEEEEEEESKNYKVLMDDIKEWQVIAQELEDKVNELEDKIDQLEREKVQIEQKTKDEELAFYRQHMKEVEAGFKESLERQEEIADEMLAKRTEVLEDYIEVLTNRLREASVDNDEDDDENEEEDDSNSGEEDQEAQNKIMALEEKLQILVSENLNISSKLQLLKEENELLKTEKASLETISLKNQEELSCFKQSTLEIQNLVSENQILNSQLLTLKEKMELLETEKASLEAVGLKNQDELSCFKQSTMEIQNLVSENKILNSQLLTLKEKMELLETEKASLEAIGLKNQDELSCSKQSTVEIQNLVSQNQILNSQLLTLKEEKELLKTEKESLQTIEMKYQEKLSSIDNLKRDNQSLENKLEKESLKVCSLQDQIKKLNDDIVESSSKDQSKMKSLESQVKELQAMVTQYNSEIQEKDKKQENIDVVKQKLQDSRTEFDKLVNIVIEKESEISLWTERLESSKKECSDINTLLTEKEKKIQNLTKQLETSHSSEERLKMELNEMENFKRPVKKVLRSKSRKQTKRDAHFSVSDEEERATENATQNLDSANLEASRSPLQAIASVLQNSPTVNAVVNGVNYVKDRVTSMVFNNNSATNSEESDRPTRRQTRRKLYKETDGLLESSPTDEPSPPKYVKRSASTRSKGRKK